MAILRTFAMLCGALAVLMLGAVSAPAMAANTAPPCHAMAAGHGSDPAPTHTPDKPMKSMACCVACVAAPTIPPPERAVFHAPAPAPSVRSLPAPAGQSPAPEPGPPRSTST